MTPEDVLRRFDISLKDVVAIYPYGSRVYGCHAASSDYDWVIVYRSFLLPSGAFRDNAISSEDLSHQAICYSRSGFQSAIDSYDITALECAFLSPEQRILSRMDFGVRKWRSEDMASAVISKASASWHLATEAIKDMDKERARKNIYHALRILGFGIQMAETGRIADYSAYNYLRSSIMDEEFTIKKYVGMRNNMMEHLREKAISSTAKTQHHGN